MATLNTANKKPAAKRSDNSTVYKVTAALVALCVGIFILRSLRSFYATIGGQDALDPVRPTLITAGFLLCAVFLVLAFFIKKPLIRTLLPWAAFVAAMVGITGVSMTKEFTYGFSLLYFLWALVLVHYIIFQLYQWEFFLFSIPTATSGFLFYQFKNGFSLSMRNAVPLVIAIVSLILLALIAYCASRNKGCLVLGGMRIRLFSKHYSPFLHYLAVALWIVCIPVALLLGDLFCFYCMFAAIAVEFIAAVYYTFQLN